MVVVELSNLCRICSVAQKHSSTSDTTSSRFSLPVIGPISASARWIAAWPPGTSRLSGGSMNMAMK